MIVFVPLKDHSERVPGKNMKVLGGKPLWRWHLDELSTVFELVVNVDGLKLFNDLSRWAGTLPNSRISIHRRKKTHVDWERASSDRGSPIIAMIADYLLANRVDRDQIICLSHVTSPFLKAATLQDAEKKFLSQGSGSLHAVSRIQNFIWEPARAEGVRAVNFNPSLVERTQDLAPLFQSNAGFFIFKAGDFLESRSRNIEPVRLYELTGAERHEIDTEFDWTIAECLAASQERD